MLMEAPKNGHTPVVELLMDYPDIQPDAQVRGSNPNDDADISRWGEALLPEIQPFTDAQVRGSNPTTGGELLLIVYLHKNTRRREGRKGASGVEFAEGRDEGWGGGSIPPTLAIFRCEINRMRRLVWLFMMFLITGTVSGFNAQKLSLLQLYVTASSLYVFVLLFHVSVISGRK